MKAVALRVEVVVNLYMKKDYILIAFFIFTWHFNFAQSLNSVGVFPTIDHSGTLSRKFEYSLYYFGAFPLTYIEKVKSSNKANFLLAYAEQAVTYNINKRLSFTGSYVFQRANVLKNNYSNENRIYVQATYKHALKNINIKHRLRFDNRFIHDNITGKNPYTHRLRYLIGADFSLKNKNYITTYEELFFNTNQAQILSPFAENWAYAAFGKQLNKKNKIELGLLYITWRTGAVNWYNQYYLQLTWINHLNFNK